MISKISLSEIIDTYDGNEIVLTPLIKALKKHRFLPEIIPLYINSPDEFRNVGKIYKPLPFYAYLIKAYNLAYPSEQDQSLLMINAIIIFEEFIFENWNEEAVLESSKLKVILSQGNAVVNSYAQNILKKEEILHKLSRFGDLVNNSEVENDS